jgi:hypothetical protein
MAAMAAGLTRLCVAQEDAGVAEGAAQASLLMPPGASEWRLSAGLVYQNHLYEHDALQQRQPLYGENAGEWENGDTSGGGIGVRAIVGRGEGWLDVTYIKSDYTFNYEPVGGEHTIETISRDLSLAWWQIRGRREYSAWGSVLGFRYCNLQKDITITEDHTTFHSPSSFENVWLMFEGGYFGHWYPFQTPVFQVRGGANFLLGEASGWARGGSDTNWTDAVVSETYDQENSLAYGANYHIGVAVVISSQLEATFDYKREWLYSFDATDTGLVVFPDNDDALFIENQHTLTAALSYLF